MEEQVTTSANKVVRNEKGQIVSGTPNPHGRPKGSGISITTAIKRELEKRPEGSDKATYLQLLVKKIMDKAIVEGDQQMIKQVWNYVDGLPVAKTEITGKDGIPFVLPAAIIEKNGLDRSTREDSEE